VVFRNLHDVEQRDLVGRTSQANAPIATSNGFDEASLVQRLENLEEEQFGYAIGPRDFGDTAEVSLVGCAVHQHPYRVVRLLGQPHADYSPSVPENTYNGFAS